MSDDDARVLRAAPDPAPGHRLGRAGATVEAAGAASSWLLRTVLRAPDSVQALEREVDRALAAFHAIADHVERIRLVVEPQSESVRHMEDVTERMERKLDALAVDVGRLSRTLDTVVSLLPDPDGSGPLARVRDALTPDA